MPQQEKNGAKFLRNNPRSVLTDNRQRRIQINNGYYRSSLNSEFVSELKIDFQSALSTQYLITGLEPVIITEPSIVIQPNGGELERE